MWRSGNEEETPKETSESEGKLEECDVGNKEKKVFQRDVISSIKLLLLGQVR